MGGSIGVGTANAERGTANAERGFFLRSKRGYE